METKEYYVLFLSILFFLLVGELRHTSGQNNEEFEVYIVQEDWHTGIIFKTDDIDYSIWPEIVHYLDKKYVDVGWGDEKFYQVPGYPFFIAARAVLFPTQSVLRVFPYDTPILSAYFEDSRILRIQVNRQVLNKLSRFVSESYQRNEKGEAQLSRLYENNNHYFLATRNYHLFFTCNTWVALAWKESGFDVRSFFVIYAKQLFRQLRDIPNSNFLRE